MNQESLTYESRVDPAPRVTWFRRRRKQIVGLLVSVAAVALLVNVVLPSTRRRTRCDDDDTKCGSNLRQIGSAIQLYVNDNRGRLPPDLATVLATQDLTSEVFICPSTNARRAAGPTALALIADFAKPGRCSYVLASPLPTTVNALTPAHVLAYEPVGNHGTCKTHVVFGDGRCEYLTDARAAYLISELKAGFNPPR